MCPVFLFFINILYYIEMFYVYRFTFKNVSYVMYYV